MKHTILRVTLIVSLTLILIWGAVGVVTARPLASNDVAIDKGGSSQPVQVTRQATVVVDVLNVRAGPGYGFDVIEQVTRGDELIVLGLPDRWLNIRTPVGTEGYVLSDYIVLDAPPISRGEAPGVRPRPSWGQRWWPAPSSRSPLPSFERDPGSSVLETDEAGNAVRVSNQTPNEYVFEAQQFLALLRDEGVQLENISVILLNSPVGNRSMTSWGRILVDCNPIHVPVDNSRPAPAGNGKTGAEFCNAVALHEAFHLITLVRNGWGGLEAEADAFASQRLLQYVLIKQP